MNNRNARMAATGIAARCCLAAALAGMALASPASAQTAAAGKATPPTKAQMENAILDLRVIMSALQSDKVDVQVKDALAGCMYGNTLAKISDTVDMVIARNPGKIDRKDPNQLLGVIAGVCGYKPPAAAAAPAPAPAPKK